MVVEFTNYKDEYDVLFNSELDILPRLGDTVNFTNINTKIYEEYIVVKNPEFVLGDHDFKGAICTVMPVRELDLNSKEILLDIHKKSEYIQTQLKLLAGLR